MNGKFSLPPGFSGLDGAVAADGWFVCWRQRQVASWSPSQGWIRLPDTREVLSIGHATGEGLVLFDESGGVGFWAPGASDWSWWSSIGGRTFYTRLACSGPYLIVTDTLGPNTHFEAWHAAADRFEKLSDFLKPLSSPIVAAAQHRRTSGLVLACGDGFYRFMSPFNLDGLWRLKEAEIIVTNVARPPICGPDRAVAFPTEGRPIVIDFSAGTSERTHFAHIGGCDALWRAFVADELQHAPLILDALEHVPSTWSLGDDLLDLVVRSNVLLDVATTSGVMTVHAGHRSINVGETDPPGQPQCSICGAPGFKHPSEAAVSCSIGQGKISEILTWRGLVDRTRTLREAAERLLEYSFINDDVLIDAFCHYGGGDAAAMILDHARTRDTAGWSFGNLDRVKRVFGRFGSRNADLITRALRSSDPATIAVGLAGAAASAVWTADHPAPVEEIRSLLHHRLETIANLAMFTCGYLKLAECAEDLVSFLDGANPRYRETAIRALGQYPSLNSTWLRRIAERGAIDVDDGVRIVAIETLASQGEPPDDCFETLIHGLGDTHISVRKTAGTAIGKLALRLSEEQLFRIFDIVSLLIMAGHLEMEGLGRNADDPGVLRAGIDSIPGTMIDRLAAAIEPRSLVDLDPPGPDLPSRFNYVFLFSLFAAPFIECFDEMETDGYAEMRARFEAFHSDFPLTESEIEAMSIEDPRVPPLAILGRAMCHHGDRFAGQLAVLALFARRERVADVPPRTTVPTGSQFVPLHRRLQTTAFGGKLLAGCRDLVSRQIGSPGIASLSALFCLAATGDSAAESALSERILSGKVGDVPIAPVAFMHLLDSEGRRFFLTSLLAANAVPIRVRHTLFRDWDSAAHGPIAEQSKLEFLRECAGSEELPRQDRLEAARRLAEHGEGNLLEALRRDADVAALDADGCYEYGKDMLRAGRGDFIENTRGGWIERRDFSVLTFFAAFGTAQDIPELKRALDLHQADYQIHQTIYAIQQRIDEPEGDVPDA